LYSSTGNMDKLQRRQELLLSTILLSKTLKVWLDQIYINKGADTEN